MSKLETVIRWRDAKKKNPFETGECVVLINGNIVRATFSAFDGYWKYFDHDTKAWEVLKLPVTHFALPQDITTTEVSDE